MGRSSLLGAALIAALVLGFTNTSVDGYGLVKLFILAAGSSVGLLVSPVPRTLLDSPAALFLGVVAVGTAISPDPLMSTFGQVGFYYQGLASCLLVFAAYQLGTVQKKEPMLQALVASCCVCTAIGIGQYFGKWLPYPIFFGNRIYSTVGNPAYLGCHLALGTIAAVIIGWYWTLPLLLTGIVMTGSRASILMIGAALLPLGFKRLYGHPRAILMVSVAVLAAFLAIEHSRWATLARSDLGRFHMRRISIQAYSDHPWRGYGPERFNRVIDIYRDKWTDKDLGGYLWTSGYSHNSFLDALVAGGIPLFVAYVILLSSIGFLLIRHNQYETFALGLALFIFGLFQPTPIAAKGIFALILGSSLPDRGYWYDREANLFRSSALGISLACAVFFAGSRLNKAAADLDINAVAFNASRRLLPMLYR